MLTIVALLFMKFAVSAYACPMSATSPGFAASQAKTEIPGPCGGMDGTIDTKKPGLCLQHAQYGFQSTTRAQTPAVIPVALTPLLIIEPGPETVATSALPKLRRSDRRWSELLALSILHCCFRF